MNVILIRALIAVSLLAASAFAQAPRVADPEIAAEIAKTMAVDNHTHVPKLTAAGEKDTEYDALPCGVKGEHDDRNRDTIVGALPPVAEARDVVSSVDPEEAAVAIDQPRVAEPETAILLQAGVDVLGDLSQFHRAPLSRSAAAGHGAFA